jgi:hypothetical protein
MDSSDFPVDMFSSLVANVTNSSSYTLKSIASDTITGVEGRRLFVNSTEFYSFQLLHVTRVRVSIQTGDDQTASAVIRYSLPHEVALCGIGIMGLDGVEIWVDDPLLHWFTFTYIPLPGFVAQYLILGWGMTVLLLLCYCCCRCGQKEGVISASIVPVGLPEPAAVKIQLKKPVRR